MCGRCGRSHSGEEACGWRGLAACEDKKRQQHSTCKCGAPLPPSVNACKPHCTEPGQAMMSTFSNRQINRQRVFIPHHARMLARQTTHRQKTRSGSFVDLHCTSNNSRHHDHHHQSLPACLNAAFPWRALLLALRARAAAPYWQHQHESA